MITPRDTPTVAIVAEQGPGPVEDQHYKRLMLVLNQALVDSVQASTTVKSTAFEASRVLKSSAGNLHYLAVFNSKASAQFILIMDAASLPGDGPVSLLYPPIPIAAGTLLHLDLPKPLAASTGIVVCNSSTGTFSKTIGSADCAFFAQVSS